MDTKLKKFNDNMVVRVCAFVLCIIFFTTTMVSFGLFANSYDSGIAKSIINSESYKESQSLYWEFNNNVNYALGLLDHYKGEENIKAGNTIHDGNLEEEISSFYYEGSYSDPNTGKLIFVNPQWNKVEIQKEVSQSLNAEINGSTYGYEYENPIIKNKFKEVNKEEIAQIKNFYIEQELRGFKEEKHNLDAIKGMTYYVSDGKNIITNVASPSGIKLSDFTKQPAYLTYKDGVFKKVPEYTTPNTANDMHIESILSSNLNENLTVYLSFDEAFLAKGEASFLQAKEAFLKYFPMVCVSGILTLFLFFYLLITTGRKDDEGKRKLYTADKLFIEIQLATIMMPLFFGAIGISQIVNQNYAYPTDISGSVYTEASYDTWILGSLIIAIAASVGLWILLSLVRNLKAGTFLEHSIFYRICKALYRGGKSIYNGGSIMRKIVLIAVGICLLSATIFLAPVVLVIVLIFAPKWVKKYEEIRKGIKEVKNGNLSYKIPVTGDGELDDLAQDINAISEASSVAIQNELKNQRLKTDLISNVSHDLKTPLTSIITYIDLLKTEGLGSQDAPKYLDILDQKADRLKNLTEDLFEAAKASSGAIPVKLEKVEILSLINQGLGELSHGISQAGLRFKINSKQEKYYVNADGQLLWRVIENLLGNTIKYAQENSRVYIDIAHQESKVGPSRVLLEMKNISKHELNMDPDELMERFKRGDEARTDEGSGLGLAIAKDLVKLQGGWFEIKIDGDLFKATVLLNDYPEEKE